MVRESFKISVIEFFELERTIGLHSMGYMDREKVVLSGASDEELDYFFKNLRDKNKNTLFHDEIFMYYYLEKVKEVPDEMLKMASSKQMKMIFRHALKSDNLKYIEKLYMLCPINFKKEQLLLARALAKGGKVKTAILKPDLYEPVRDYLLKIAFKKLSTDALVGLFSWCTKSKNKCLILNSEQREKFVNVLSKRKDIPYYMGCLFSRNPLKENEIDKFVYALGKFGDYDIIETTSKLHSNIFSSKNMEYLRRCYNSKLKHEFCK